MATTASSPFGNLPDEPDFTRLIHDPWRHQLDAVTFVLNYLNSVPESEKHAAIVRMPTGSGKTGVMAVVANYSAKISSALILTPAEFLREQITAALKEDFWRAVKAKPPSGPKPVFPFVPTSLKDKLEEASGNPAIYVCTQQTLAQLFRDYEAGLRNHGNHSQWGDEFTALRSIVSVLFVDEGHREPAKEWARAVRSFKVPTVLFTATPYRNDVRFFRVGRGDQFRHKLSYEEALTKNIVRKVEFVYPRGNSTWTPNEFADQLVKKYRSLFRNAPKGPSPKVVIRCAEVESINEVQMALAKKTIRENVIAIHESFTTTEEALYKFKEVPSRSDKHYGATYWVHQYKLTEGFDDSDFKMVAFYEPFRNSRSMVQQIGRIVRNASTTAVEVAYVFSHKDQNLKEQWDSYQEFEKSSKAFVGPDEIVDSLLDALPEWFYYDTRYRHKADLYQSGISADIKIPKSVLIYKTLPNYTNAEFDELVEEVSDVLQERDIVEITRDIYKAKHSDLTVLLSWRVTQSPRLANAGLFDVSFLPSVFCLHHGYVFYQGAVPLHDLKSAEGLRLLSPQEIELLLNSQDSVVSQISLINCDIGPASIRRKSFAARALDDVVPGLNDHMHFVSSAVTKLHANSGSSNRRYIGFTKSRVTDASDDLVSLDDYSRWVHGLSITLRNNNPVDLPVLRRYADYVPRPKTSEAAHILIDLVDFYDLYESPWYDIDKLRLTDETLDATAAKVDDNGRFTCKIGQDLIKGKVLYKPAKGKFVLESQDLNKLFTKRQQTPRGRNVKASSFLTNQATIKIITKDLLFYTEGKFYNPRTPLWGKGRVKSLGILEGIPDLETIDKGEKGETNKLGHGTWQKGSVFHLIDTQSTLFSGAGFQKDILICDDLGTEYADFILIDLTGNKKVAIIHAKMWGSPASFSADDFQIINSQVVKNLELLNAFGTVAVDRSKRWNSKWKWRRNAARGLNRIRVCPRQYNTGSKLFNLLKDILSDSETEKEVWIVLGGGFSIGSLNVELDKDSPQYHIAQLAYLLQSCNHNVSSVGAKFRIFSSR